MQDFARPLIPASRRYEYLLAGPERGDRNAEEAQDFGRRSGIQRSQCSLKPGPAWRHSRKEEKPMGQTFVTGSRHVSLNQHRMLLGNPDPDSVRGCYGLVGIVVIERSVTNTLSRSRTA